MNVKFFQYACLVVGTFACGVAVAAPASSMFATSASSTSGDSSSRAGGDAGNAHGAPDTSSPRSAPRLPVANPNSSDDDVAPSPRNKPVDLGWPSLLPGSIQ
jgi:hypothetical protein